MSDKRGASSKPSARLVDLKAKVDRATVLIGELREANYALSAELAELKNRWDDADRPAPAPAHASAPGKGSEQRSDDDAGVQGELATLRAERETVRKKLEGLLSRIQKLES